MIQNLKQWDRFFPCAIVYMPSSTTERRSDYP